MILNDFYEQLQALEAEKLYSSDTDLTKMSSFMNMRVMARSRERYGNYIRYLLDAYRGGFNEKEMTLYQKICYLLQNIADTWWKMSSLLLEYEYLYQQKS